MSIDNELDMIKNNPYMETMRDAIHDGIKKGYDKSVTAENYAAEVKDTYDNILLQWDSDPNKDPELVTARDGESSLNDRLDRDKTEYAEELISINTKIENNEQENQNTFDTVTAQLAQKTTKGEVTVNDINKNKGLFDESYFTDEVKQQWTGQSTVSSTVADKSVTSNKLADRSVDVEHISTRLETNWLMNVNVPFEIGSLSASSGGFSSNSARIRTRTAGSGLVTLTFDHERSDISYALFEYEKDLTFINGTPWIKDGRQKLDPTKQYKLIVKFDDERSLTESDIDIMKAPFTFVGLRKELEPPKEEENILITPSQTVNYLDLDRVEPGYYGDDGEIIESDTASRTHLIDIRGKSYVEFYCNHIDRGAGAHNYALFDKNGVMLEHHKFIMSDESIVHVDLNNPFAKWISIAIHNHSLDDSMIVFDEPYPDTYIPYGQYRLKPGVIVPNSTNENTLNGLKWGVVGDSIKVTGYKGDGLEYPKQISDRNNMVLNNVAVSGSGFTEYGGRTRLWT